MASTFPPKSHSLHNFTLPHHLKWNKDGKSGGHHHRRRSIKSPSRRPNTSSPSPIRQSPLPDSVSATPPRHQSPLSESIVPPSPARRDYHLLKQSSAHGDSPVPFPARRSPIGVDPPPSHLRLHHPSSSKGKGESIDFQRLIPSKNHWVSSPNPELVSQKSIDSTVIKKSKIVIKIPSKNNKAEDQNRPEEAPKIDTKIEAGETNNNHNHTDEETKIWNLRPRKPIPKPMDANKSPSPLTNQTNNKSGENGGQKKKQKRKLSIFLSLSKEEIEEDIFSLTGAKPARRPKKRPKYIQKQVDSLFPGSWLVSITADSYKVSENS